MFENVDDKPDTWELVFSNVINQHASIVEKRVKRKKLTPWMDSKIIECIRARDEFKERANTNIPASVLCTRGPGIKLSKRLRMLSQRTWEMKLWRIWTTQNDPGKHFKKKNSTNTAESFVSFLHWNRWSANITDLLSMASTFNNNFTKIQLSANSAAPADENLQADINATLLDFIKSRIDDSTQFNVPLITTK